MRQVAPCYRPVVDHRAGVNRQLAMGATQDPLGGSVSDEAFRGRGYFAAALAVPRERSRVTTLRAAAWRRPGRGSLGRRGDGAVRR
jgi:hypothetical protein